jgi:hypothetical protein
VRAMADLLGWWGRVSSDAAKACCSVRGEEVCRAAQVR